MGTDQEWEKWGSTDPYFSVLTSDKFRSDAIDDTAKAEFFDSGERDIEAILTRCRTLFGDDFAPKTALDFGCGVGRLVLPLAKVRDSVVGVDVSPSMLDEARKNLSERGIGNADLRLGDDRLSRVPEQFDLVNSLIVLQHIPTRRGIRVFEELVKRVKPGGAGAMQLTYSKRDFERGVGLPDYYVLEGVRRMLSPLFLFIENLTVRKTPQMQMNQYHLNQVFFVLQKHGVKKLDTEFLHPMFLQDKEHLVQMILVHLHLRALAAEQVLGSQEQRR